MFMLHYILVNIIFEFKFLIYFAVLSFTCKTVLRSISCAAKLLMVKILGKNA